MPNSELVSNGFNSSWGDPKSSTNKEENKFITTKAYVEHQLSDSELNSNEVELFNAAFHDTKDQNVLFDRLAADFEAHSSAETNVKQAPQSLVNVNAPSNTENGDSGVESLAGNGSNHLTSVSPSDSLLLLHS